MFKRFSSFLDEIGLAPETKSTLEKHVVEHIGSDEFSSYPYEDIDIALKYISDFPSLELEQQAKEAQRLLRRKNLVRPGQGAEHPDLYGEWGHPDAID